MAAPATPASVLQCALELRGASCKTLWTFSSACLIQLHNQSVSAAEAIEHACALAAPLYSASPSPPIAAECRAEDGPYKCLLSGCLAPCSGTMLLAFAGFCIVCMAAHVFGKLLSPLGLPTITLFIGFGALCGPFGLGLVDSRSVRLLSWVNDFALGYIGFSAGGHFHVSEMGAVLPTALVLLSSLVVVTYCGTLAVVLLLGDTFIPFFDALQTPQRVAAALLIACLSVARSPSSAIAIISELNARGTFTSTVLAVTVLMDVVVVILFSITLTVARTLDHTTPVHVRRLSNVEGEQGDGGGSSSSIMILSIVQEFITEVSLSAAAGYALGHLLPCAVVTPPEKHGSLSLGGGPRHGSALRSDRAQAT